MHDAARRWLTANADPTRAGYGVDLGGRDINGTGRDLFPNIESWTVVDNIAGDGVNMVGDATRVNFASFASVVLCTEVLEHCRPWGALLATAYRALRPSGLLLVTAAGPRRRPHRAGGGGPPIVGEWYRNIDPVALRTVLVSFGFHGITVDTTGYDVRAKAYA